MEGLDTLVDERASTTSPTVAESRMVERWIWFLCGTAAVVVLACVLVNSLVLPFRSSWW
ncbi:MAG: hypothetical protein SGJ11_18045 [Phycisphaerae bacterium]|nr:hypothetical protein [Phycisphaerae bacterium]